MRLAKYLARAGIASRRASELIIAEGRVQINGIVEIKPQTIIKNGDKVTLDGEELYPTINKLYVLLNKPAGYISTVRDTHSRPTVIDLVKKYNTRLYPVGRLDYDTSGVLLLTNDGELAYRLTHPKYGVKKIYRAIVKGRPGLKQLAQLSRGMEIEGSTTAPAAVKILKSDQNRKTSLVEIELTEGRKRQVKKMFAAINYPVIELERLSFAGLTAGPLKKGEFRSLTAEEVGELYRLTGLS